MYNFPKHINSTRYANVCRRRRFKIQNRDNVFNLKIYKDFHSFRENPTYRRILIKLLHERDIEYRFYLPFILHKQKIHVLAQLSILSFFIS
jgi:hypothetical protein